MPRLRRMAKTRRTELTHDQFFELWLGPSGLTPDGREISDFESPFLRRAAWYANREALMEDPTPGMRPWGFWEYEIGHHPADVGMDGQAKELRHLKLLSDSEKAQLEAMRALSGERKRRRRKCEA